MHLPPPFLLLLLLLLLLLSNSLSAAAAAASTTCLQSDEYAILAQAFNSTANLNLSTHFIPSPSCPPLRHLRLASLNISGTISFSSLLNLSSLRLLDLSHNQLSGSIPGTFFLHPALLHLNLSHNLLGGALRFSSPSSPIQHLNLSSNRFTSAASLSDLRRLRQLDLSRNGIVSVPEGLANSSSQLSYLDLSCNGMAGNVNRDLPPLLKLRSFNLSYNKFTGNVDSAVLNKFGRGAFIAAGHLNFIDGHTFSPPARTTPPAAGERRRKKKSVKVVALWTGVALASSLVLLVVGLAYVARRRRIRRKREKEERNKAVLEAVAGGEEEARWAAEADLTAPVVVFEKPLMELLEFTGHEDGNKKTGSCGKEKMEIVPA